MSSEVATRSLPEGFPGIEIKDNRRSCERYWFDFKDDFRIRSIKFGYVTWAV